MDTVVWGAKPFVVLRITRVIIGALWSGCARHSIFHYLVNGFSNFFNDITYVYVVINRPFVIEPPSIILVVSSFAMTLVIRCDANGFIA
jgi:hypothetical protein